MSNLSFEKKSCVKTMRCVNAVIKLLADGKLANIQNMCHLIPMDHDFMRNYLNELSRVRVLAKRPKVTGEPVNYVLGSKAKEILAEESTTLHHEGGMRLVPITIKHRQALYTLRLNERAKTNKAVLTIPPRPPEEVPSIITPWHPNMSVGGHARIARSRSA